MKLQLYGEATLVGILVVICGSVVASSFRLLPRPSDPKHWNDYHYMEACLFLTGVMVHLGCEWSGLNKMYCTSGYACKRGL